VILWLLLSLVMGQGQRPSAPASRQVPEAGEALASSGEDAYIVWTVDATTSGMSYQISLDNGPWVAVSPADLKELYGTSSIRNSLLPLGLADICNQ